MNKTNDMNARQWWSGSFPAGILALFFPLLFLLAGVIPVAAAPVSNVVATKHNLSKTNAITGAVKTSSSSTKQDQVCVFCHTPHAATANVSPLWNKSVNAASAYTGYTSLSMDADSGAFKTNTNTGRPAGGSLLCLSCHDGTLALGTVGVLNREQNITIALDNTNAGTMPTGSGTNTGFTRVIGQDLSNDHPISVTYNDTLATDDGELRHMNASQVYSYVDGASNTVNVVGLRTRTMKPQFPLLPTGTSGAGQIQCPTCHDPHLYDADDLKRKFLRGNRLQAVLPAGGDYSKDNDIICLACHDKMATEWSNSIHAVSTVAYTDTAATLREFPTGTQVWKAACLNCHDTHTVAGARRLLREGTDDTNTPKKGGKSAIEETCYQCHTAVTAAVAGEVAANTQASALTLPTFTASAGVPNIKTEFLRRIRMPIATGDQGGGGNTTEVHDISNADFIESDVKLGKGVVGNRHVECTDCHNPHRVIKNSKFNATGSATKRTHDVGGVEGNVASGVLRGAWGVEPVFPGTLGDWPERPSSYDVKKGVAGSSTARSSTYLTREYQLCFKCHSDYANSISATNFPALRGTTYGGTPDATNSLSRYTNVAAEFGSVKATDPPSTGTDQGEETNTTGVGGPCGGDCNPTPSRPAGANNHRSWHPVMWPTGRTRSERGSASGWNNLRAPFVLADVGKLTMHCSDCHGHNASWVQDTGPDLTKTQGPHGSTKNFLLKGDWIAAGTAGMNTPNSPGVCGNCHNPTGSTSGFAGASEASHNFEHKNDAGCTFCHIALPHGWKNKAFLVNLNCVGPESGEAVTYNASGCVTRTASSGAGGGYYAAPYYVGAKLTITGWAVSGGWGSGNCNGVTWMQDSCGSW